MNQQDQQRLKEIAIRRFRYWLRRIIRGRWRGDSVVSYAGEFGHELKGALPYAYWLHLQGRLKKTVGTPDTRCFYYFSPQHEERHPMRRYRNLHDFPMFRGHTSHLDRWRWVPPPLRATYANRRFRWPKPPLIISNKYTREWTHGPVNYLDIEVLRALFDLFQDRYTILYNRPVAGQIVPDGQEDWAFGDHELIAREYPHVIRLSDLWRENQDITFNTLQCMVYSGCDRFISVQGGASVLASYFGGRNIIFVRKGDELTVGAYRWFDQFSGCRVFPVGDNAALLSTARREFA
jgi:hypothetical protein